MDRWDEMNRWIGGGWYYFTWVHYLPTYSQSIPGLDRALLSLSLSLYRTDIRLYIGTRAER